MTQETVLKTKAIRQAEGQLFFFEELADFANLGDTPKDWAMFRSKYQEPKYKDFFPSSLADWLYKDAENWARFCSDYPVAVQRSPTIPPLLWYRDLLRAVWKRQDPAGAALCQLLGFVDQAKRKGLEDLAPTTVQATLPSIEHLFGDFQPKNALGQGEPVVTVAAAGCTIRWEFGCQFQQAIYELMQDFWRAKICPECKRFFLAEKTAQKFCSSACYGRKKERSSLDYYHREGRQRRQERSKK